MEEEEEAVVVAVTTTTEGEGMAAAEGGLESGKDSYCDSTDLKRCANYIPALGDNLKTLGEELMALTISQNRLQERRQGLSLRGAMQALICCPMRPKKIGP
ncbi:hypothetical protein H5410_005810 [Solanum commersonii]|uniref:Uncharacterized protein n=1 Tax=Solanum commersonii TaxID=4109 RepID=A0A9J6A859_SOLCO|nr:hypothetical protein H5410_005810 [Solanum commersonii]